MLKNHLHIPHFWHKSAFIVIVSARLWLLWYAKQYLDDNELYEAADLI